MDSGTKKWVLKPTSPDSFRAQCKEYPDFVLHLLWQRGITTPDQVAEFLTISPKQKLHDPFLFRDMDKATDRLNEALIKGEKILVFGDYDADGTCGTVILTTLIRDLGGEVFSYLPDRFEEGHGLTEKSIAEIKRLEVTLVITVDCGVTENWEIEKLNKYNIDTVVLDHHLPAEKLPSAVAVIDAKREDNTYPFSWLCGTGVAFKFVQAMMQLSVKGRTEKKLPEDYDEQFYDIAAIATIADTMPLIGENRTLLLLGLSKIARTARLGLRALLLKAGLSGEEDIDAEAVAFAISPRINAASRIDHANIAFALLTTKDEEEAESLAQNLEGKNQERQKMVTDIFAEAEEKLASLEYLPAAIILNDENWSLGVIGIVANKLLEKWNRPVFLFTEKNGLMRGSARSPEGFDLVAAMGSCGKELFVDSGGHARAAGAAIKQENFGIFTEKFQEYTQNNFTPAEATQSVDLLIGPEDINWDFWEWIQKLAPYGENNPTPHFLLENLEVVEMREVGKKTEHLQLKLFSKNGSKVFKAILFKAARLPQVRLGSYLHCVVELIADKWNGQKELKLKVIDWQVAAEEETVEHIEEYFEEYF